MISNELFKSICSGKAVLFLGAGASQASGGPIGTELADFIANELGIEEDTSDLAIFTQTVLHKKKATRKQIELCIKERLQNLLPSDGYKAMTNLPWKSIFSVNYDDLVEQAYRMTRGRYSHIVMTPHNLMDDKEINQIRLYKLHGSITDVYSENKPLLVTYDDLIKKESFKQNMLKILTNSLHDTIIFVGYSFSDKVIEEILNTFKTSQNYDSIKQKYVISPNPSKFDITKFDTIYSTTVIDSKADEFFIELNKKFESDFKARLEAYGKSLSIFQGDAQVNFDPSVKSSIDNYFDYYDEKKMYRSDAGYYYRCGTPEWGNILHSLDINRNIIVESKQGFEQKNSIDIPDLIYDNLSENKLMVYKITGPIAVGKTTFCYRIAYDLFRKGVLALYAKTTESIQNNLLVSIYQSLKKPFVVIVDDAVNYNLKISKMIKECEVHALPITFLLSVRENDWEWLFDKQIKNKLNKNFITLKIDDHLNKQQSIELADKLIENRVFAEMVEFNREDLIQTFQKSKNLVASLITSIDNTDFERKIVSDYDRLSVNTKNAYGMISLINRLCLPFKWELLQRSLQNAFFMDWSSFIESVVQVEAKGNIIEGGEDGNFFYTCRHNIIAEIIARIHYKEDRDAEVMHYKKIIKSLNPMTIEEIFIGKMLQYIVSHSIDHLNYTNEQIIELLDCAISVMSNPYFLLHVKGQYLMDTLKDYHGALKCFNKCIRDGKNAEYSMHSGAMAHLYLATSNDIGDGVRTIEIKKAKDLLKKGRETYESNVFFYKTYMQVVDFETNYILNRNIINEVTAVFNKYKELDDHDDEIFILYNKVMDKKNVI